VCGRTGIRTERVSASRRRRASLRRLAGVLLGESF
jgi:hypothetical protein